MNSRFKLITKQYNKARYQDKKKWGRDWDFKWKILKFSVLKK